MLFVRQFFLWVRINILEESVPQKPARQADLREMRIRYSVLSSTRRHPSKKVSVSVFILTLLIALVGLWVALQGILLNRDAKTLLGACIFGCGVVLAAIVAAMSLLKEEK